jgi:SRSO17 transposase
MDYIQEVAEVIGHRGRASPLRDDCTELMTASAPKGLEPMAAITAPERTAVQHRALLHFIG